MQCPVLVFQHEDQALHLAQALAHEARRTGQRQRVQGLLGRIDDIALVHVRGQPLGAAQGVVEPRDVVGLQFESDAHG